MYEQHVLCLQVSSDEPLAELWEGGRGWNLRSFIFSFSSCSCNTTCSSQSCWVYCHFTAECCRLIFPLLTLSLEHLEFHVPWKSLTGAPVSWRLFFYMSVYVVCASGWHRNCAEVFYYHWWELAPGKSPESLSSCHWVNNKMYCFTAVQMDWFITGDNKTNLFLPSCHGH